MTGRIVPLYRAADWPPSLREACDEMEREAQAALDRNGVPPAFSAAKERFGREVLALDKARRPEFYRVHGIG